MLQISNLSERSGEELMFILCLDLDVQLIQFEQNISASMQQVSILMLERRSRNTHKCS